MILLTAGDSARPGSHLKILPSRDRATIPQKQGRFRDGIPAWVSMIRFDSAIKGFSDHLQPYLVGAGVVSLALATYAGTTQLPPTPKVPERSSPTIRSTGASSSQLARTSNRS